MLLSQQIEHNDRFLHLIRERRLKIEWFVVIKTKKTVFFIGLNLLGKRRETEKKNSNQKLAPKLMENASKTNTHNKVRKQKQKKKFLKCLQFSRHQHILDVDYIPSS